MEYLLIVEKRVPRFVRRCDIGEYRIIYGIDEAEKNIKIFLVEDRNDDKVYRQVKRIFG